MASEQSDPKEDEAAKPETEADAAEQPERPLNRAERRAQAHGKGIASEPHNLLKPPSNPMSAKGGARGLAGKVRFPRTGHK